jgi:glycosyltransferase involved in cell wall biosynthesis
MSTLQRLPLTVWMNMPSFYQNDLFRSLAGTGRVDLQVIFARQLAGDRRELGWTENLAGFEYCFLDSGAAVLEAMRLARLQRKRLHMVNGLWAEPAFAIALIELMVLGSRYVIYSEAPENGLGRSPVKAQVKRIFGESAVRQAAGLLPVSRLGEAFFRDLGASADAIYPFGYFRSAACPLERSSARQDTIELIFVGQLVHRKGLDVLLEALDPLWDQQPGLLLTIVGTGQESASLRRRVEAAGINGRVCFEGTLTADKIPQRIAQADALVLPSRWDGWGLVVNEALSVGVPVLVSDRCGAADLVQTGVNGWVFRSEDSSDLQRCLQALIACRSEWPRLRSAALATGAAISTETVAPYLVACLECMSGLRTQHPSAPWLG